MRIKLIGIIGVDARNRLKFKYRFDLVKIDLFEIQITYTREYTWCVGIGAWISSCGIGALKGSSDVVYKAL